MEPIYTQQAKPKEESHILQPEIKMLLIFLSSFLVALVPAYFVGQIVFVLAGALLGVGGGFLMAFLSWIVIIIIVMMFQRWSLKKTKYIFYNDRVEYYEGFLVKNRKVINYDRITNVGQKKGIIEGLFGLGTIFIDTAGSSQRGHELAIKYLNDTDQVFDWITRLTRKKTN